MRPDANLIRVDFVLRRRLTPVLADGPAGDRGGGQDARSGESPGPTASCARWRSQVGARTWTFITCRADWFRLEYPGTVVGR